MGQYILQQTAMVTCDHQGQGRWASVAAQVTIAGAPVLTVASLAAPHIVSVSGCPLTNPSTGNPMPCATINLSGATTRVTTGPQRMPLLLASASGPAIGLAGPQGSGRISGAQTRVNAQ